MNRLETLAIAATMALTGATSASGNPPYDCDAPEYQNRVKEKSVWLHLNRDPSGFRKGAVSDATRDFLEQVAYCEWNAKDPKGLIADIISGTPDGTGTLTSKGFSTDLGYELNHKRFGMSSGTGDKTSYVKSTRRPTSAPADERLIADIFAFTKQDNTEGNAAAWQICGNIGEAYKLRETLDLEIRAQPDYGAARVQFENHVGCQVPGDTVAVIPVSVNYDDRLGKSPQYADVLSVKVEGPDGELEDKGLLTTAKDFEGRQINPLKSTMETMAFGPGRTDVFVYTQGKNGSDQDQISCDSFAVDFTPGTYRSGYLSIMTKDATVDHKISQLGMIESTIIGEPDATLKDCIDLYKN